MFSNSPNLSNKERVAAADLTQSCQRLLCEYASRRRHAISNSSSVRAQAEKVSTHSSLLSTFLLFVSFLPQKAQFSRDHAAVTREIASILRRNGGFPDELRGQFWIMISGADIFQHVGSPESTTPPSASLFDMFLEREVDRKTLRTIQVDLTRTFPRHQFFRQRECSGAASQNPVGGMGQLSSVLMALAAFDPETGQVGTCLVYSPLRECSQCASLWQICARYGVYCRLPPHVHARARLFRCDGTAFESLPLRRHVQTGLSTFTSS